MLAESPPVETLPPPPRPLTPRVRRRAWAEPHVRFWWLAAAALVAAGVYMFIVNYVAWRREAWLIRNGTLVQAKLERSGGEVLAGRPVEPEQGVLLSFDWNGRKHETWGTLRGRAPKVIILTKSTVAIRVDPADPDRWTYRKEPPSLAADLLGAALAFALAPLAMLAAVTLRRGGQRRQPRAREEQAHGLPQLNLIRSTRGWLAAPSAGHPGLLCLGCLLAETT